MVHRLPCKKLSIFVCFRVVLLWGYTAISRIFLVFSMQFSQHFYRCCEFNSFVMLCSIAFAWQFYCIANSILILQILHFTLMHIQIFEKKSIEDRSLYFKNNWFIICIDINSYRIHSWIPFLYNNILILPPILTMKSLYIKILLQITLGTQCKTSINLDITKKSNELDCYHILHLSK